jgi:hypothetical protein
MENCGCLLREREIETGEETSIMTSKNIIWISAEMEEEEEEDERKRDR